MITEYNIYIYILLGTRTIRTYVTRRRLCVRARYSVHNKAATVVFSVTASSPPRPTPFWPTRFKLYRPQPPRRVNNVRIVYRVVFYIQLGCTYLANFSPFVPSPRLPFPRHGIARAVAFTAPDVTPEVEDGTVFAGPTRPENRSGTRRV